MSPEGVHGYESRREAEPVFGRIRLRAVGGGPRAPVAAMVVQGETVHVVATRRGEPIYWYALSAADLTALHRLPLAPREGGTDDDVLDAWATPGGGLWLELDHFPSRARAYAFAEPAGAPPAVRLEGGPASADGPAFAQDACAGDYDLFVPVDGRWTASSDHAAPPTLSHPPSRARL